MTVTGGTWVRLGKFSAIGVLGAALQVIVFEWFIRGLHLAEMLAAPIAVEIVLLHNFCWHERFTWRDRRTAGHWQRARRLWRFHATNGLVSIVGNTVLINWLVERFELSPIVSSLGAIAACALLNFVVADCWVYRALHYGQNVSARGFGLPRYLKVVGLVRVGWKRVAMLAPGVLTSVAQPFARRSLE